MRYWKTTHTKPDVCSARDAPTFCRMISGLRGRNSLCEYPFPAGAALTVGGG